jgi:F-type H+-transporting ATPase subunit delta
MIGKVVALRYARALFEAARENGVIESITRDVSVIKEIFAKVPRIKQYCLQAHKKRASELDFINIAFLPYVGKFTQELLKLAVGNGRITSLPFIPMAFESIMDKESDSVLVGLETAHESGDEFVQRIARKMEKRIGKKIKIEKRIVPGLLGGFRILWQNRILDMSAAGRLKKISRLLRSVEIKRDVS